MHLKSFIIGLFLFCIGGGMLWWVVSERQNQQQEAAEFKLKYGSETTEYVKKNEDWMKLPEDERPVLPPGLDLKANKSYEQIVQEQQERLKADIDKLAAGEMTLYPNPDDAYGSNWREKIEEYKKQKEHREFLYNISIGCAASGGLLAGWIILLTIARLIIKIVSKIKNAIFGGKKDQEQTENQDLDNKDEQNDEVNDKSILDGNEEPKNDEHFQGISSVLVNSGWQYSGSFGTDQKTRLRQRKRIPVKNRALNEDVNTDKPKNKTEINSSEKVENNKHSATGNETKVSENKTEINSSEKVENNKHSSTENETKVSENKTKSETIIKHDVDIANKRGNTHQIDNTLKDLTQQVSAIREYAANQQNRLERLQDGYDWNIIKTFCLRIIRCIDNIDKRIEQLTQEDIQATHLEEVRDELVFALESSGIEQFEPEANTCYRGQEKIAEAVKEKAHNEDPNKKGKIEKVIKPGYQFYIDDKNVKIVRPAQVRLFA